MRCLTYMKRSGGCVEEAIEFCKLNRKVHCCSSLSVAAIIEYL